METKFNENDIEQMLKNMKACGKPILVPAHFTASVMDKIKADSSGYVNYFESVYRKFLIGGTVAAAAAVILAFKFMNSYNSFMSEYAMMDILTGTLF